MTARAAFGSGIACASGYLRPHGPLLVITLLITTQPAYSLPNVRQRIGIVLVNFLTKHGFVQLNNCRPPGQQLHSIDKGHPREY